MPITENEAFKEENINKYWLFKKNHIPWNKDKPFMKGKNHPMFGKKRPDVVERNKKIKKGKPAWNKGLTKKDSRVAKYAKTISKTFKKLIKEGKLKPRPGGKEIWRNGIHPNWQGGKSFEPYGIEFNKKLKEQIRQRYNFTCQECGFTQEKLGYKLHVHHIDFNKKNNNPNNLISLCRSCHTQTEFNRENWTKYFQNKVITFDG